MRSKRTTKYRLQIATLIIAVSLLGLFIYNQHHGNNTHVEHTEKQVFVSRKTEPVDDVPVVETTPPEPTNCAYRNCPKLNEDVINVHVICHTHLDPGWLNSVDGYFFGVNHDRGASNGGRPYRHTMPSVLTMIITILHT
ncbi:unnamed protein product [Adineta steineri]|uniref:Uncharacterized protein n=1 Tax=Adineta steineri TaxID=433720 RepID=A0A815A1J0_9BILA|nr:unnamed protein product [Adineta steineri]